MGDGYVLIEGWGEKWSGKIGVASISNASTSGTNSNGNSNNPMKLIIEYRWLDGLRPRESERCWY